MFVLHRIGYENDETKHRTEKIARQRMHAEYLKTIKEQKPKDYDDTFKGDRQAYIAMPEYYQGWYITDKSATLQQKVVDEAELAEMYLTEYQCTLESTESITDCLEKIKSLVSQHCIIWEKKNS